MYLAHNLNKDDLFNNQLYNYISSKIMINCWLTEELKKERLIKGNEIVHNRESVVKN